MGTFITAYVIVGLAVVLYVARLGAAQRRLEAMLESLDAPHADDGQEHRPAKAA